MIILFFIFLNDKYSIGMGIYVRDGLKRELEPKDEIHRTLYRENKN